jgi:hypothetical protein
MRTALLTMAAALAISTCGAAAQDLGVASCDSFLKTYESCVAAKVPADQRAPMTNVLQQLKTNWKAVAATADGKTKLDATCKETAEAMKKQVAALNCAW